MRVGIEASNIRAGGGLTHLVELLNNAEPEKQGIESVVIWSGNATLNQIPDKPWLVKKSHPLLDKSILHRVFWIRKYSQKEFQLHCDVLFTPGGLYSGDFKPFVSMSQNMLVFEQKERARFGWSPTRLRLKILSFTQSKSLKKARAVIFISHYAKKYISTLLNKKFNDTVIYHGIDDRFKIAPRPQREASEFTPENPMKLLYVSIINEYKHQNILAEAVNELNKEGFNIELTLVGAFYPKSLQKLQPHLTNHVKYLGKVAFNEIHNIYKHAELFIFPSTCENMPNIMVEAMSAGLPIISSNFGPMPEILQENGLYVNPLKKNEVKESLKKMYEDKFLREKFAQLSYQASAEFSWKNCADRTFEFLASVKN